VNIHEAQLPVLMKDRYERWCKTRTQPSSRTVLLEMYQLLVSSRKSRIISDLKSLHTLPPYYTVDPARQLELAEQVSREYGHSAAAERGRLLASLGDKAGKKPAQDALLRCFRAAMKEGMASKEAAGGEGGELRWTVWSVVSVWQQQALDASPLWEELSRLAFGSLLAHPVSALQFFHRKMTHQEKPIYLYHAILLLLLLPLRSQEGPGGQRVHEVKVREVGAEEAMAGVADSATLMARLPDYVHDIHTGAADKVGASA
jgi:hypothetical protein